MPNYLKILQEELILALGCTEPIAIALAAAHAGALTGEKPETIDVYASGSIIKNANSVYVPHSGGRQGVLISAALGAVAAAPELKLRVLQKVDDAILKQALALTAGGHVRLHLEKNVDNIYIRVKVKTASHTAQAVISQVHHHLSYQELDGKVLLDVEKQSSGGLTDRSGMSLQGIYDYATSVSLEDSPELTALLDQQIHSNMDIAREGLAKPWGQEVGRTLHDMADGDPFREAIALAAAASDARMAGCDSPVTINAGSGNQGITCSVAVVHMAHSMKAPPEKLYRALILSNLIAIYAKQFIGKLSAFCGVVTAAAGAGCGIAFLQDMPLDEIQMTLTNTLATSGGIICDGAKGSCASKIAVSLHNAALAIDMSRRGKVFQPRDGIVGQTVEDTIRNIGTIAAEGMVPTDQVILKIMTDQSNHPDHKEA